MIWPPLTPPKTAWKVANGRFSAILIEKMQSILTFNVILWLFITFHIETHEFSSYSNFHFSPFLEGTPAPHSKLSYHLEFQQGKSWNKSCFLENFLNFGSYKNFIWRYPWAPDSQKQFPKKVEKIMFFSFFILSCHKILPLVKIAKTISPYLPELSKILTWFAKILKNPAFLTEHL